MVQSGPGSELHPSTGLIDSYVTESGSGELLVKNGTDGDGVVILTTLDDAPVQAAYIRSGESYNMTDIPDGEYGLYFSKGEKWNDKLNVFTEAVSRQRFDDVFDFSSTLLTYSSWEVTLYGVSGGTTSAVDVPDCRSVSDPSATIGSATPSGACSGGEAIFKTL